MNMAKYHIKKDGTPGICHAEKGKCPLGGASGTENHFNTQAEAQAAADKMHAQVFNTVDTQQHGPSLAAKGEMVSSYGDRVKAWEDARYNHSAPAASTDPKDHPIDMGWDGYEQKVESEEDIDYRDDLSEPITLSNGDTYTAAQYSFSVGTGHPTVTLLKDKENLSAGYLELYPTKPFGRRDRDEIVFDRTKLGNDADKIINALDNSNSGVDNTNPDYPSIVDENITNDMFSFANLPDEAIDDFENEYDFTKGTFSPDKK